MIYQFFKINSNYAFGYRDNNQDFYFPHIILPVIFNPNKDKAAVLFYLIKLYLEKNDETVREAINFLNPAMRSWSNDAFINYIGNDDDKEYSDDSDNETVNPQQLNRSKSILKNTGKFLRDNLEKRALNLVDKLKSRSLNTSTLNKFIEADTRTSYFPPNDRNESIENDLRLINLSATDHDYALKIQKVDNKEELYCVGPDIKEKIANKYYIPLFRGISYLVDRYGTKSRRAHAKLKTDELHLHFSEAVVKTVEGDYYQLTDYKCIDEQALLKNAKLLKEKLLQFKTSEPVILNSTNEKREFANFLDYLQHSFSNGIENFLNHLDIFNHKYPNILPNNRNPFVPFSHLPFHSIRYAFGEKNPYADFAINPAWDDKGRARRRHVGKVIINLVPLEDILKFDEPNVVPVMSTEGRMSAPKVIGSEYEVSFLSYIPKSHIFKSYNICYPNFHTDHKETYIAKYGLSKELYEGFKACILNPATRDQATVVLKTWLCLFTAIKVMHEAKEEITLRNGIMAFRHPDGTFNLNYPTENYQVNKPAINENKAHAVEHYADAETLFKDMHSYSKTRSILTTNVLSPPPSPLSKCTPKAKHLALDDESDEDYQCVSPQREKLDDALLVNEFSQLAFKEANPARTTQGLFSKITSPLSPPVEKQEPCQKLGKIA